MQVEAAKIQEALRIAAQIVTRDGAVFLPVFLALEAEAEATAGRNSALERALALSGGEKADRRAA